MPVLTHVCPICQGGLNVNSECVRCLLRVGLDTAAEPDGSADVPRFFGDFQLAFHEDGSPRELGRGAMGVTCRAMDQTLHRAVALKVVKTPDGMGPSPAIRERFLREARGAASLHHPNVAEIFQFGTSPETAHAYYAMELIDGETLEERVRREGALPVVPALEIAVQIARALVAASDRDLVHRDLKPGNVMLARKGPSGTIRAVVIDFGLAKAMAEVENRVNLTNGGFVGTPAFASPEQFRGEPADARSDIYSLGATLWYALTGHAPFAGKTLDELRDHPARTALPLAQLTSRRVPPPVVALLRSALAVEPRRVRLRPINFWPYWKRAAAERTGGSWRRSRSPWRSWWERLGGRKGRNARWPRWTNPSRCCPSRIFPTTRTMPSSPTGCRTRSS